MLLCNVYITWRIYQNSHFIREIGQKQSKCKGFYGLWEVTEKKVSKGNSKEKC